MTIQKVLKKLNEKKISEAKVDLLATAKKIQNTLGKKLEKEEIYLEIGNFYGGKNNGFFIIAYEEKGKKSPLLKQLEKVCGGELDQWAETFEDTEGKLCWESSIEIVPE